MFKNIMRKSYIWIPTVSLVFLCIFSYLLIEREISWLNETKLYSWHEIFGDGSRSLYSSFKWIVVIYGLALINVPLTLWLFQKLPDRGWILGRGIALIIVVTIAWNLSIYRILDFRNGVWFSIAVLVILNLTVALMLIRKNWRKYLPISMRPILISECVFIVIFAAMFVIRLNVPEIYVESYGVGNKPADLALLTSIVRSPYMAPVDSYLSSEYLNNYYYYGHVVVAWLLHLTGIEPEVFWNLTIPFFFALSVGFGFCAGYNMMWLSGKESRSQWIGGFAVVVIIVSMVGGTKWVQPLVGIVFLDKSLSIPLFSYSIESLGSTVETPLLTFLLGEIHPNSLFVPFTILTICIGITIIASRNIFNSLHGVLLLVFLGLCAGTVSLISFWDAASVVFVSIGIIIIAGVRSYGFDVRLTLFGIAFFILTCYALFSPFLLQFEKGDSGIDFVSMHSVKPSSIFFYFIVPFISLSPFIFASSIRYLRRKVLCLAISSILLIILLGLLSLLGYVVLFILNGKLSMLLVGLILISSIIFHLYRLNISHLDSKIHLFIAVLLFYSIITFIMMNLVSVHETDLFGEGYPQSNGNSLYKFYSSPIIFLSFAGAWVSVFYWNISRWLRLFIIVLSCISLIYVGFLIESRLSIGAERSGLGINGLASIEQDYIYAYRSSIIHAADIHISLSAIFDNMNNRTVGANAVRQRELRRIQGDPNPGDRLYGMYAFDKENIRNMFGYVPLDAKSEMSAIRWMRYNVPSDSVIMKNYASNGLYFFDGANVSSATGLMAVLGSEVLRMQNNSSFEGWAEIQKRTDDITSVYTTEDISIIKEVLSRYGVDYVYFGESERVHFGENANEVFQAMTDTLDLVFQEGNVYVYQVNLE